MALSIEQLRDMLLASLPEGPLWPRSDESNWAILFEAIAPVFAEIDALDQQLLTEMRPATTELVFDEWEADLGLPDDCIAGSQTLAARRTAMIERHTFVGRQDKQFFIDLAARLGFVITIDEFSAASPGPAGNLAVVRPSGETFHVSPAGDEWNYVWRVNAPLTSVQPRTYASNYGEAYSEFDTNEILECTLRQFAHEHRVLIFAYV